jgi:hypothetical protein
MWGSDSDRSVAAEPAPPQPQTTDPAATAQTMEQVTVVIRVEC